MSNNMYVYVGFYIKVKSPPHTTQIEKYECPICGEIQKTKYCPDCGHEIKKIIYNEETESIYDTLEEFSDIEEDTFEVLDMENNNEYETMICLNDSQSNVLISLEEEEEFKLPSTIPNKNWNKLFVHFDKLGIKYKKYFGGIVYSA